VNIGQGVPMTLKLAVPNKGRLNERAVELLRKAGLDIENNAGRKLYAAVKNKEDMQVMFLRAQDIVRFVHGGAVDVGITGHDLVMEADLEVEKVLDLDFGHCRLVVAAPEASNINSVEDVKDGTVIATSFPNLAWQFFASRGKMVEIVQISGAAEVTPHIGVADIIVDLVSSGSTLRTNRMVEVETIIDSQAVIIANKEAMATRGVEITELVSSIHSVIVAEQKKYLMADVPKEALEEVRKVLPGIAGPTVMNLVGRDDMVAIHVVVEKDSVYDAVHELKRLGASGILIMPIDRLVA
jgi:ATP phosphoribosyltransferase